MIHNNNSNKNSFSYSIGSSGCSNNSGSGSGSGGSGGSSSEADSIFFFAEEKEILLSGVGREDSKHNFSGNYIDSPSNKNNSSGIGAANETGTTTGSVMTMRRSNNFLRERGMEPCEEKHPQQRQLHHNVIPVLKKKQDPPPSSSTGCTTTTSGETKRKGLAKHHDSNNNKQKNTMKKRQNFDMWVMRQQQQQQLQQLQFHQHQRDGNMSILTDEMSEVHLQYHLSQKRLQKQQQQQQQQQLHQSHSRKNQEEGQPQSQGNEQRLERSEQIIPPQHYMQQHPSQISLNRRRYDEQPFTNTTLHPKEEEEIVREEEEEEDHGQLLIQYHCQDSHHQQQHQHKQQPLRHTSNKNHAHSPITCFDMQSVGIPNHHRRRWRQQQQVRQQHQRSRYSEVGDDYVMKKVDEEVGEEEEERGEDNDEEIVQHEHRQKQQQQQQQTYQLQYHHQRWQVPPPSLQRESTLQHNDDHRPPPPPQQQQPRLSSHLSPGSNILGHHKQKMQQPWSRGELGCVSTKGTAEKTIEVEELVLDMEEDVPIHQIVDRPNQHHHHHHHHHHHRTGNKNVQEGGMAVVQLVKNLVQMAELDEPRTMLPTQQQQPLLLPSTLELAPTSVTASLRPPTHPDSRSPSNNTSANIGSSSTPATSSSLKEINPTLSIGYDGNLVPIQEMTREDDALVMPPPTLLSVAPSSFSSFSPEQGAITSPLSPTIATTTSASCIATAVAQRNDGNSPAAKHDESYNTSTATNDRNNIRPDKLMNHMSEQSPTRSDHSADNAAGLGNSFGHVSFGGGGAVANSSSSNNNTREKNSTTLPSTSSLFMKKGAFLLSGTSATKPFSLKGAPAKCSIDTSVCESSDECTIDSVKGSIPRKVSFDESEVEVSIPPTEKVLNLEGKLSGLLQRQRRQLPDVNDMMMISRSRTFDSSNTNQSLMSSLQLSIESECVRQNARIAEMMEGAMMDFFAPSQASESNEKRTSTDAVPATDYEDLHVRTTEVQTSMPGLFFVGDDDQNELVAAEVHDAISPSNNIAKVDSVSSSRHKMTHPEALRSANNDNKDLAKFLVKFSDHILNGCNNYDTDSSDVFFINNSQFGKEEDASRFEGNLSDDQPDKKATNTAAAPHNLTRSAAFGRDVSSISEDSDEENLIHTLHPFEKSRSLPNLPPASTFLSAKERARIRQHDTTPVRANTSYARYRKYVHMHSDGDISMASIKEEMAEEEEEKECDDETEKVTVEKVNVNDERDPILEKEKAPYHTRDDEMGGVLSEAFDHYSVGRSGMGNVDVHDELVPSCDSATNVAEYNANDLLLSQSETFEGKQDANLHPNMMPHCQVFETSESEPLDPVSLDVDRSEDFDENNQSLSSDSILDVIKMTFREQQKGRSLAWHSTNGVNYDEVCDSNQMPRFKATGGASIAGRLNSMTMSRLASTFRQHTDDVPEDSSAVKRHQLGLIEETSLEDDGESEHCSRGGIGIDHEYIQSDQERSSLAQAIKSSSMSEAASSSASGSKSPIPAPRSSVQNRVVEHLPSLKENSFVRDAKKNASTKDLPPIIRFEMQPNSRPPHTCPQPVRSKQTNLGESGTCFARSNKTMKKSQFSHAPSSRLHPHHVPRELPRSRLEEKLRTNSIRESRKIGDCGNSSVGTSELGSLFTRDSERSRNLPVPSVIFHRTYPRLDLSISKSSKEIEFSGADVSSKDISFSEGSKSSSCTPDSGYPILNGRHLVNLPHTSPLHADESNGGAMGMTAANPARQIIDISEIIYNFKAVGSTIAKLGEELFENATTDAASPNALGGYAPDNEQYSAVFLDETDVANSEYGIHQPEQQQEQKRIIKDTSVRYDIENKADDVDPSNKNIKLQQQIPIASIKDNTSREPSTLHDVKYLNNDNKHQGQNFWRKIDEHKVRSFWSQLELDDELSTSKLQHQPQQRVVPVIKALNKNVGRRVADDASASHHSSIFEAFEVAPLRFICRVGDGEKPATLLNDFGVHHSYVRPVSFANNLVYPENADDTVLYPSNLEPIERTNVQLSCHSASIVNKEKSERLIVDANDHEMRFDSFRQRPKTLAVEQGPHPNNKARQSIRGKWKNIVMAGPAMMASTRH